MHRFVHGLHHLYKNEKRLFTAAILNLLKIRPILVFQLAAFLRWPSLASAVMVVLGGLISQFVVEIFSMWMLIKAKHKEKIGTYDSIQDCEFHPYSVREFLNDDMYEDMDKHIIKGFAPFDFDKIVRIYRVYRPGVLRGNLQCFAAPLFGADIFISDKPSETRGIMRLLVLHEIGHSLLPTSLDSATALSIRPYLFFLLWASFSIQWDRNSAFVFVAYAMSILAWMGEWRRNKGSFRLQDEIFADAFAFINIDIKDVQRIARGGRFPDLNDPDMDALQNLVRMTKLREYLELALEGRTDDIFADGHRFQQKPQLLSPAAAVILTAILGCYAPAPSAATLYWSIGLLVILVTLSLMLTVLRIAFVDSLDSLLRSRVLMGGLGPSPESAQSGDGVQLNAAGG